MSSPLPPPHPLELPGLPAPELGSRALFPELEWQAYLAHAAISPANSAVSGMVDAVSQTMARHGAGAFPVWMQQRERLRSSIADLLCVEKEDVTLSAGCTHGITDVALALPWEKDETLLTFDGEFPANVSPWQQAAELRGGRVCLLPRPDGSESDSRQRILEVVEEAVKNPGPGERVRFVAVSAVQFQTGLAMPLRELGELCAREGLYFLVDAIQGCGVIPYDLRALSVDAFFVGAHKWLLGLEGSGFFITSQRLRRTLTPLTAGWLSYRDGDHFLFRGQGRLKYDLPLYESGRMFEGSTSNAMGCAAMEAGLSLCAALGPARIFSHVQSYHDELESRLLERGFRSLRARDPSLRSCLLSVALPKGFDIAAFAAGLREHHVLASTPDGLLRFAPHFSNHNDEISQVVAAVDAVTAKLR